MKKLLLPLFLVFSFVGVQVSAQTFKVGYTEPETLLLILPEYKVAMQKLDTLYAADQSELRQKAIDFQNQVQDYEAKMPLMSDQARQSKEQELGLLQNELEQLQSSKSTRLNEMERTLMQPILGKISDAINKVAKEKGLDMVFSSRANGSMILLYAKEDSWDISLDVLKALGVDTSKFETSTNQ